MLTSMHINLYAVKVTVPSGSLAFHMEMTSLFYSDVNDCIGDLFTKRVAKFNNGLNYFDEVDTAAEILFRYDSFRMVM